MPSSARRSLEQEKPRTSKKDALHGSQLASYDDIITDALVDRVYFWTQTRKIRSRYTASRGIREEDVTSIIRDTIIVEKDPQKAVSQLLELPGFKKHVEKLAEEDKSHFTRHLRKYVNIYLPDCPFEVTTTNRYTIDSEEAKVTARKLIRKGELIKYLSGMQVQINPDEEKEFDVAQQFSIVLSSRKGTTSLFLGPARFANHDCDANSRLTNTGPHLMTVLATKDINPGDEITVSYGSNYFGTSNRECLCSTCEYHSRNGWDPTLTRDSDDDDDDEDEEAEAKAEAKADHQDMNSNMAHLAAATVVTPALDDSQPAQPSHFEERALSFYEQHKIFLTKIAKSNAECLQSIQGQLQKARYFVTNLEDLQQSVLRHAEETNRHIADVDEAISRAKLGLATLGKRSLGDSTLDAPLSPNSKRKRSSEPLRGSRLRQELRIEDEKTLGLGDTPLREKAISVASSSTSSPSRSRASASTPPTSLSDRQAQSLERDNSEIPLSGEQRSRLTRSTYVQSAHVSSPRQLHGSDDDMYATNPNARRPGDYRDACVLSSPCSRWVKCRVCDEDFVHADSYHLRWSCLRCIRHSKLYGYQWPKTDREGKHDTEERIHDHRTVNWLVPHEEAKQVKRGKKAQIIDLEVPRSTQDAEKTEKAKFWNDQVVRQNAADSPKRGRGRPRKRPLEEDENTPQQTEASAIPAKVRKLSHSTGNGVFKLTKKLVKKLPAPKFAAASGVVKTLKKPTETKLKSATQHSAPQPQQDSLNGIPARRSLRKWNHLTPESAPDEQRHAEKFNTKMDLNEPTNLSIQQDPVDDRIASHSQLSNASSESHAYRIDRSQDQGTAWPKPADDITLQAVANSIGSTADRSVEPVTSQDNIHVDFPPQASLVEAVPSPEASFGVSTRTKAKHPDTIGSHIARALVEDGTVAAAEAAAFAEPPDIHRILERNGNESFADDWSSNKKTEETSAAHGNVAPMFGMSGSTDFSSRTTLKKPGELNPVNWHKFGSRRPERPPPLPVSPARNLDGLEEEI